MAIRRRKQILFFFYKFYSKKKVEDILILILSYMLLLWEDFLKDSMFPLLLAPLLATAQLKPGETQEEEANSGEVWKHWNTKWVSAGSLVLLEPPDMWNLWLTRDVLHNQATVDHWRHRSTPAVTGLLNEASIQKCEERFCFIWSRIISYFRWEVGWWPVCPGLTWFIPVVVAHY